MSLEQWQPVIGLELHVQLATKSKIFSGAAIAYGAEPNRQACALDLGMPGTLPVLNGEAVRMAIMLGHAIGGRIADECVFARKNYFYPDLPKGYQISQYEQPIVAGGGIEIEGDDGKRRRIGMVRAHLEEDAGKSIHDLYRGMTAIDLNRAGTPLIEIVSEPELHSAAEAVALMRELYLLVVYLGICDGNLQEGSFRCDANVSVRPRGSSELGVRAEIKNMNSFRFVERAIDYEIHRQVHRLESGAQVIQETRLYDSARNETRSMRSKEEAEDYRYFPDPDLLPLGIERELSTRIRDALPELPAARRRRYRKELGLGSEEIEQLIAHPPLAAFFEAVVASAPGVRPKRCANWVLVELSGALHKLGLELDQSPISAPMLAGLVSRIGDGTISGKIAKAVFEGMLAGEGDADQIIAARGLRQISDSGAIREVVRGILADSPAQVEQYRGGEAKVLNYFVGQVMQATRGQANPGQVRSILSEELAQEED